MTDQDQPDPEPIPLVPKKKRLKKKIIKSSEYDIHLDDELPDGFDFEEFETMLIEALRSASQEKKYSTNCKSAIAATLDEFSPSYIFIGYDFKGSDIEIIKSNSQHDTDAIGLFLQRFISKFFSSIQQKT